LVAEIKREFPDAQVLLIPGSGGVFEVTRDGVNIFSKKTVGRHARPGEVLTRLREPPAS
jgi:selT/selW/selH-like putative selenoprotein